jgi:group I intron endonuclease
MLFNIPKDSAKLSGIYSISNSINNKVYIGSAVVFERRFRQHKHQILSGKHPSKHLLHHVAKYGIKTLSFDLVELSEAADILQREQYYLDMIKPFESKGFNTSPIAGSTIGVKHTEEARKRMSLLRMGKKPTEETRKKMAIAQTGRKHSAEAFEKMFKAQANKSYGEVARKNMSLAHIGHKQSEETKNKRAAALRGITKNGDLVLNLETGIFYSSIKEAAATTQLCHSTLHRKLVGKFTNNTSFIKV